MKRLMIYHSKQGHTESCMNYIKEQVSDIESFQVSSFTKSIQSYDSIIIGTPVYMGSINKHIKSFILLHEQELLSKEVYFVVCAMNDQEYDEMIIRNIPETLRNHATILHPGGGYDFTKLNFLERFIVKKIAHVRQSESHLNLEMLQSIK